MVRFPLLTLLLAGIAGGRGAVAYHDAARLPHQPRRIAQPQQRIQPPLARLHQGVRRQGGRGCRRGRGEPRANHSRAGRSMSRVGRSEGHVRRGVASDRRPKTPGQGPLLLGDGIARPKRARPRKDRRAVDQGGADPPGRLVGAEPGQHDPLDGRGDQWRLGGPATADSRCHADGIASGDRGIQSGDRPAQRRSIVRRCDGQQRLEEPRFGRVGKPVRPRPPCFPGRKCPCRNRWRPNRPRPG